MSVHEKAKTFREQNGFDIETMAKLTELSKSYISMLENGKRQFSKNAIDAYLKVGNGHFTPDDFFQKGAAQQP